VFTYEGDYVIYGSLFNAGYAYWMLTNINALLLCYYKC